MICLLSGPDLLANYIIFSKPTILQVRCTDPISILRNLCPWHSALFAVNVLFDCSNRTFSSCLYAVVVTVCRACCVFAEICSIVYPKFIVWSFWCFQGQWNGLLMFVIYIGIQTALQLRFDCYLFFRWYVLLVVYFKDQQYGNRPNLFPSEIVDTVFSCYEKYLYICRAWLSMRSGIPPPTFNFQFVWFLFLFSAESQGPERQWNRHEIKIRRWRWSQYDS